MGCSLSSVQTIMWVSLSSFMYGNVGEHVTFEEWFGTGILVSFSNIVDDMSLNCAVSYGCKH